MTPEAKAVIAAAPLQYVGVFRNAPLEEVVARAQALGLAAVQLHGDEDRGLYRRAARRPRGQRPHLEKR